MLATIVILALVISGVIAVSPIVVGPKCPSKPASAMLASSRC